MNSAISKIDTIDGIVDAILVDTGTTLPATTFNADVVKVSGNTTSADNMELAYSSSYVAPVDLQTITGNSTGIANLLTGTLTMVEAYVHGTPSTTVIVSDTSALSSVNDNYNNRLMMAVTGTLAGQVQEITDYIGSSKTFTTSAWTSALSNDDKFLIV